MHARSRWLTSWGLAVVAAAVWLSPPAWMQQKPAAPERGGQEEFGPYEFVEDWPKPLPDSNNVNHAHPAGKGPDGLHLLRVAAPAGGINRR